MLAARTALDARSSWDAFSMRIAEVMLRQRFGPIITDAVRDSVTALATLDGDLKITLTWNGLAKPPASAAGSDVNSIKREVRIFAVWWRRNAGGSRALRRGARMGSCAVAAVLPRPPDHRPDRRPAALASGEVRLWHPALATAGEVAHWRDWLLEHDLRQPFKQAYREIYLLTDAERETRVYSNRFAAHVLRYGQVYALFKERG